MRLTRIDDHDLNLFDFDYDLTFMVFFLNADEKVYARYGGRDGTSADCRQSLDGLKYTMESVLAMHERESKQFAPRIEPQRKYARDVTGWYGGGCMHCHQVKEAINEKLVRNGNWKREMAWRFPLPENVGLRLEVDRGNVVEAVLPETPAAAAGLEAGDRIETIGAIPIHSFADVQLALDRGPQIGAIDVAWQRGDLRRSATLTLGDDWKKSDLTWRASSRGHLVPTLPMSGEDLTPDERRALGLSATQLAFRGIRLKDQAKNAGFRVGDVVVGVNERMLEMTALEFRQYIRREFLAGDTVTISILRDGQPENIPLKLSPP